MARMYAFHKTVRGQMHKLRGIPCEDASASFACDDGKKQYCIAAVADGHGASACFRSARGAQIAVDVAIECLKTCADTWVENFRKFNEADPVSQKMFLQNPYQNPVNLRQLTDTILARWYDRVMLDYETSPLTPEEKADYPEAGKPGGNIPRIYGTTLIAALWLSSWLILIQQGDGRCDVFYQDGSADQPIPWDARCQANVTTSLCDRDAAVSFRSCIINSREKKPIACFLESDGVEDAYRDTYDDLGETHGSMRGVHTFNKELIGRIIQHPGRYREFEAELEGLLQDFSANGQFGRGGSGDDVSVAGIVEEIDNYGYRERYKADVDSYERDEKLFWLNDALRSKTRKLGILEQRYAEAKAALRAAGVRGDGRHTDAPQKQYEEAESAYHAYKKEYERIQEERNQLLREQNAKEETK